MDAINKIMEDSQRLQEIVGGVNNRTESLEASTQEIAASAELILSSSQGIWDKLQTLREI